MKTLWTLLLSCVSVVVCHAQPKSRLLTHLEAGEKQVVVAYGTSLTAEGPWVKQVSQVLQKQFPGQLSVINSGGSGKWSDWGVANLDTRVISKHPDTVFIEFSMNDCVARFQGSVEIAQKNLVTMIDAILKSNPQCEIILMTMTLGNAYPEGHTSYRKDIEKHYDMYRAVAKARGLLLIDHYPNWKALQLKDEAKFRKYVPDTIHSTAEGCAKVVAPVVLAALGIKDAVIEPVNPTKKP